MQSELVFIPDLGFLLPPYWGAGVAFRLLYDIFDTTGRHAFPPLRISLFLLFFFFHTFSSTHLFRNTRYYRMEGPPMASCTKDNISFVPGAHTGKEWRSPNLEEKEHGSIGIGEAKIRGPTMIAQFCTRKDNDTRIFLFPRFSASWTRQTTREKPCCGRRMPKWNSLSHMDRGRTRMVYTWATLIEATWQCRVPRLCVSKRTGTIYCLVQGCGVG
ncbi:hypothetical protein LY76DRAFT_104 [Colletotrichum caudatum]|nr:hypothetical protein LY76DRAFT_104 [Colletotrichum caudatum]